MKNELRHAVAAALGLLAPMAVLAQSTEAQLEEIVVSAERVEENLQTTPVAVTAFGTQRIETLQIFSTNDLSSFVPNLKLDPVSGGTSSVKPYIRGAGTTDGGLATSESAVGFYIDDVYRSRLSAANLELLDVERIEVLRGPQGTLYGRNSSGGAIKFHTRAPGEQFKYTVSAGYGQDEEMRLRASASGRLVDNLYGGVSAIYKDRDVGRQFNRTQNRELGEQEFRGGQIDLRYTGIEGLDARFTMFRLKDDSDGQYPVAMDPLVNANDFNALVPVTGAYDIVQSPFESYSSVEQRGWNLKLTLDVGAARLTSISSYLTLDDTWAQDFSGGVNLQSIGLSPVPFVAALFERESLTDQRQRSQEFQLAYKGERINWLAGVYFFSETADQRLNDVIFFGPSVKNYSVETESLAVFGQGTWQVTDAIAVTLGARYTDDTKQLDGAFYVPGAGGNTRPPTIGDPIPAGFIALPVRRTDTFEKVTPKFGVDWQLSPDVLAYLSLARGFKAGGYQGLANSPAELNTPFAPEVVDAIELGLKSDLLGNRLRLNVAVFRNEFTDIQQQQSQPNGGVITQNFDAELTGIEVESIFVVNSALTAYANFAYNDDKYTKRPAGVVRGERLPVVPETAFLVGADLRLPIGFGDFIAGSNYSWRDEYFSTPDNVPIGQVKSMGLWDAYVGVAGSDDRWSVRLQGKNLADEEGWQTGFAFGPIRPRYATDGRTWLLTLTLKN